MKKIVIPSIAFLLAAASANAAPVTSTWDGGTVGVPLDWNVDGNWLSTPTSGKPFPNNGTDTYTVVIGSTTGDRMIQTSGNITISELGITQAADSVGVSTLKLGGNLAVGNSTINSYFNNATGDASKFVIDLNSHTFTLLSNVGNIDTATNFTLTGGGTYQTPQFYHNTGVSYVNAGVTVKVTGVNIGYTTGVRWADTATFHYAANNATAATYYATFAASAPADAFNHLTVGDHTNTVASSLALGNTHFSSGIFAKGNVTILSYGSEGASAKLGIGAGRLNVGGNFVDEGTDSHTYGTGTIVFNGGAGAERIISTGRTGITTNFQVGRVAAEAGNVALGKDLTTTGNLTVRRESLLDVKDFTLQATNVNLNEGTSTALIKPTLDFTFSLSDSGLIHATNLLTLGFANLNITYDGTYDGSWTNGSNLELFRFGNLSAGVLENLTLNTFGDFTHSGLAQIGNSIYLTNVNVIPEPGSAALLLMSAGLLLHRWKRK